MLGMLASVVAIHLLSSFPAYLSPACLLLLST
jgi:hypothetical protein